jgi:hypothetical protein
VVLSGLIISSCLVTFAFLWAFSCRLSSHSPLRSAVEKTVSVPSPVWLLLGIAAFSLPVLEYWFSARSHGNALAGFLPWVDATAYFHCSETFLLGAQSADHCGKRPFYIAFFTDLLWLTGNRLQLALLLQAVIVGSGAVLFIREVARDLNGPAVLSAYAVLYLFAAALCASLVMSENIGLLLGLLGMTMLWRSAVSQSVPAFLFGIAIMAAGLAARPGPLFILPTLIFWFLFYFKGAFRERLMVAALGTALAVIAIGLTLTPTFIAGGTLGSAHSNFSYSLYGLVVGGENWQQVTIDHPEFFNQGGGEHMVTDRVYEAAIEIILSKPHLFVLGYLKGIGSYLDDPFRFAADLKPLRLAGFLVPWALGVWYALQKWRQPRYALLLWMQAGILVSSPFIIVDETNRIFAASIGVDALFVGLGFLWLCDRLASRTRAINQNSTANQHGIPLMVGIGMAALLLPVALFAAIRPNATLAGYKPPVCESGLEAIVVRPGRSTLILPLVKPGEETIYPLSLRADQFGSRLRRVHSKNEFRLPAGHALVWGTRLEEGSVGKTIYFSWSGELPSAGTIVGFCVRRPVSRRTSLGIATAIHYDLTKP